MDPAPTPQQLSFERLAKDYFGSVEVVLWHIDPYAHSNMPYEDERRVVILEIGGSKHDDEFIDLKRNTGQPACVTDELWCDTEQQHERDFPDSLCHWFDTSGMSSLVRWSSGCSLYYKTFELDSFVDGIGGPVFEIDDTTLYASEFKDRVSAMLSIPGVFALDFSFEVKECNFQQWLDAKFPIDPSDKQSDPNADNFAILSGCDAVFIPFQPSPS